jgi:adenylosuccinate lyase
MQMQTHYETPLVSRYASAQMSELFSPYNQCITWRNIWIALAQAEKDVGIEISDVQINELISNLEHVDFQTIHAYEKKLKHDVMAHIHAYADLCPIARPIIHLGATSCTITDNADLIIMRSALLLLKDKLLHLIKELSEKAIAYKEVVCLGRTHGQVAQPTTVGKRFALWLQDFVLDYKQLERQIDDIYFLGLKGATGTQASFLELLDGDHATLEILEQRVARALGFSKILPISGQTYTRKQDIDILNVLANIAVSAHKMATDIRLLALMKEIEEPFGSTQVGSSAMPYKRNPMKCERICSLARYVMNVAENPKYTAAIQWFERTLDDSANRRLCIPEAFLAVDGILHLLVTTIKGIQVHTRCIAKHVAQELPFLAIEYILMKAVRKGADRQEIHEKIRAHCMQTYLAMETSDSNDLFQRIINDPAIPLDQADLENITAERFIGRAPQQVETFIEKEVQPLLQNSFLNHVSTMEEPHV